MLLLTLSLAFKDLDGVRNADAGEPPGILQESGWCQKSVRVRVSLEEKETRVLALAHTLTLFQYPERTKVATGFGIFTPFEKKLLHSLCPMLSIYSVSTHTVMHPPDFFWQLSMIAS